MTRKKLNALLCDVGIMNSARIPAEKVNDYDKDMVYDDGINNYLIQDDELDQVDITNALLANLNKEIKVIKGICIYFAVLVSLSLFFTLLTYLQ